MEALRDVNELETLRQQYDAVNSQLDAVKETTLAASAFPHGNELTQA